MLQFVGLVLLTQCVITRGEHFENDSCATEIATRVFLFGRTGSGKFSGTRLSGCFPGSLEAFPKSSD